MRNELYHHGIKGQKWGVRRYQKSNGSPTSAGKKAKTDHKTAKKTSKSKSKTDVSKMSDQELRERVNRLNMEKQYKQLSGSDTSKGSSYIKKFYKVATTTAAVSGTALTLYNNGKKIKDIVDKM